MTKPMKMLEDLWNGVNASAMCPSKGGEECPTAFGKPLHVYLREVLDGLNEDDASMERIVRDAIIGYQEMYSRAPNDEAEREVVFRAKKANRWLSEHGFEPESLIWSKEEVIC